MSGRRLSRLVAGLLLLGACRPVAVAGPALRDSLLGLFDSIVAIHAAVPDTGLLRRLHPAGDTLLQVEGGRIGLLTGDSLLRQVAARHRPVRAIRQSVTGRRVLLLDRANAVLSGVLDVIWSDTGGDHTWHSPITVVVHHDGAGWRIRGYAE